MNAAGYKKGTHAVTHKQTHQGESGQKQKGTAPHTSAANRNIHTSCIRLHYMHTHTPRITKQRSIEGPRQGNSSRKRRRKRKKMDRQADQCKEDSQSAFLLLLLLFATSLFIIYGMARKKKIETTKQEEEQKLAREPHFNVSTLVQKKSQRAAMAN